MVISKRESKIQKLCVLQIAFFLWKCVFSLCESVILSQIILSIILAKYFPFSQL